MDRSGIGYELHTYVEKLIDGGEIDDETADLIRAQIGSFTSRVNKFFPFFRKEQPRQIQKDLYTFLNATEPYVYDNVYFRGQRIELAVYDPRRPSEVDEYEYLPAKRYFGSMRLPKRLSARLALVLIGT